MIKFAFDGSGMFASTSAKNGRRSPVSTLITTIGESAASDASGSIQPGKFAEPTPVSNCTSIGPVGEKPSHAPKCVKSIDVPSTFSGIAASGGSNLNPVAVDESASMYAIDGHGNMQPAPPSGLH